MRSFLYNQTVRFAVCILTLILLISPFLDTPPEPVEAAPTGVYASATVSNPSSALTDFSLMIDLSRMPAEWWSAVDTSDGTKGRAYKDDLATELATDWIDFDDGAETGWLRVKWSGTLASSGTQTIRVYPPQAANSSYAAGDTYGQYNAYDSNWVGYWPDGSGTDRTSNGNDLTSVGSPTTGATGKVGDGTEYNGSTQYAWIDSAIVTAEPLTMMAWAETDALTNGQTIMSLAEEVDGGGDFARLRAVRDPDNEYYIEAYDGTTSGRASAGTVSVDTWAHVVGVSSGDTSRFAYANSSVGTEDTTNVAWAGIDNFAIGTVKRATPIVFFDGVIDEAQIHSAVRSAAWIAHEYSQTNDNATFWGSWTASDTTDPSIAFTAATPFDGASQSSTSLVTALTTSDTSDHYAFLDLDDSLVGWWRAEGDAADDSPSGNDGTLQGDTTYADGQFGQAFSFDGTGDYVTLGDLGFDGDGFAYSTWFYWTNDNATFNLIFSYEDSINLYVDGGNNKVRAYYTPNNGSSYTPVESTSTYSTGSWHHVVVNHDGTDLTLYVDNTEEGSASSPTITEDTTGNSWIGMRNGSTLPMNGYVDDVLLFDRPLSTAEIASLYDAGATQYSQTHTGLSAGDHTITGYAVDSAGNTANTGERTITVDATDPTISFSSTTPLDGSSQDSTSLVTGLTTADAASSHYSFLNLDDSLLAWWRAEDSTSDSSGNGNGGTLKGSATYAPGQFGKAFSLLGDGNYVDSNFNDDLGSSYSISFWYTSASSDSKRLVCKWIGPKDFCFVLTGTGISLSAVNGGVNSVVSADHDDTAWRHVVGTYDGAELKIYSDGTLADSTPSTGSIANNGNDMWFGWSGGSNGPTALLDDVLVFSRALTADEVSSLYDASADQYSQTHTSLSEGDHTIQGYVVDGAGNTANTSERTITVDTTDPTISYSGDTPSDSSEQNTQSIDVDLTTADNNGSHYSFFNLDDSLVGWWRGESNATDESGNGNNGTLVGDTTYTSGQFGEAFSFDGDGDYVTTPNVVLGGDYDPWTFSFWAQIDNPNVVSEAEGVIGAGGNRPYIQLEGIASETYFRMRSSPYGEQKTLSVGVLDSNFNHFVAVSDGAGTLSVYKNGSYVGDMVFTNGTPIFFTQIGQSYTTSNPFGGSLDELMVFSRALTADEVASLYSSQSTQYSATHSSLSEGDHTFQAHTVDSAGNTASESERTVTVDLTAPVISEVTPVTTPTTDTTPEYTFTTDEAGDITYGGSCTSATTSASSGSNTITFGILSDGTYSDCTITVQDSAGNDSNTITATTFTVDAGSPTPGSSGAITTANITTSAADISWTKATDTVTAQSSLEYLVYTSSQDNISTVALAEANGDAQGTYTADIDSLSLTGLTSSTTYYVNVIVKDENDNKAEYTSTSFTTSSPSSGASGSSAVRAVTSTVKKLVEIIPDSFFAPVTPQPVFDREPEIIPIEQEVVTEEPQEIIEEGLTDEEKEQLRQANSRNLQFPPPPAKEPIKPPTLSVFEKAGIAIKDATTAVTTTVADIAATTRDGIVALTKATTRGLLGTLDLLRVATVTTTQAITDSAVELSDVAKATSEKARELTTQVKVALNEAITPDEYDPETDPRIPEELKDHRYEQVTVRIVTADGSPLSGADVTLFSEPKYATTDDIGEATFTDVPIGEHKLAISFGAFRGTQALFFKDGAPELFVGVTPNLQSGVSPVLVFVLLILAVAVSIGGTYYVMRKRYSFRRLRQ